MGTDGTSNLGSSPVTKFSSVKILYIQVYATTLGRTKQSSPTGGDIVEKDVELPIAVLMDDATKIIIFGHF